MGIFWRWLARSTVSLALSLSVATALTAMVSAQLPTAPIEGLRDNSSRIHALINARIIMAPGKVIQNGTIIFKDGVITAVGADLKAPAEARIWNLSGKTVYPGFIDSYTYLDLPKELQPKTKDSKSGDEEKKPTTPTGSVAWNKRVTPQRKANELIKVDKDETEKLRGLGFTSALIVPGKGIFRGSSALVNLTDGDVNSSLIRPQVAQHIAFEQSGFREDVYPDSLMGTIALIRQTFLDTDWYANAQEVYAKRPQGLERPENNEALAALAPAAEGKVPVTFEAQDELDILRALRLSQEFKLTPWLLASGYEYRMLPQLKASKTPLILPLDFPEAPAIETAAQALDVDLAELQHWDQAPSNAARLAEAGIPFALTTIQLKKPEDFWSHLRLAVRRGLSEEKALAALTTTPASLLGIAGRYGTLEVGKVANLVISDGNLFSTKANILTVWVDGQVYDNDKARAIDPRGTWTAKWSGATAAEKLTLTGDTDKLKVTLGSSDLSSSVQGNQLLLFAPAKAFGQKEGTVTLNATVAGDTLQGTGQLTNGQVFTWSAQRTAPFTEKIEKSEETSTTAAAASSVYPAGAFGVKGTLPQPEWLLVKNATIWTSGSQGRLTGDLLVNRGKISQVGKNLTAPQGAVIIDGTGKHVTPGLIDAHSHTAIARGVNEATHAVTAEVRIGDVVDATDIGIYRELAGGLTTANLLHGSANPMGGQNQVIKLRWGELPEALKFSQALPGIKFALGENVKQANWGDKYTTRYPQTRLGVEQLMRDTFMAARDYERKWTKYKSGALVIPPRRDLQLETILQILNHERLVHIHSYRQDEILMFIRLAEQMGFNAVTFQHILEGYKVADAMAKLGAGGSSFSDWWGYKFEVYDAIPTNGVLMKQAGVVVSFNSDSNDLARRMNLEAAKAVKYGGVTEEEALKFVTLNPAKQMKIDRWVGSLEPGKDADFVIWNGSPLSTYSLALETWIEGRKYFDREQDLSMRTAVLAEREVLIQKALPDRLKTLSATLPKPSTPSKPVSREEINYALEHEGLYHNGRNHRNCSSALDSQDL